jgi:hypothetical protein
MPIYEFYCPANNRIYQFFARTIAQGRTVPPCPDNPAFPMKRILSSFAVVGSSAKGTAGSEAAADGPAGSRDEARMEAAMGEMEREFSGVDENDPRSMGRMMRRMADLTGERLGGEMEEVVRKLEEGADPDSLEEQLGADAADPGGAQGPAAAGDTGRSPRPRRAPARDPRLYDYP